MSILTACIPLWVVLAFGVPCLWLAHRMTRRLENLTLANTSLCEVIERLRQERIKGNALRTPQEVLAALIWAVENPDASEAQLRARVIIEAVAKQEGNAVAVSPVKSDVP